MRRVLILALLLGTLPLILPLGMGGHGAEALLAFGLLVLGAYTVGELATAVRLPRIIGYLAAGVALGPSVLGIISGASVARLDAVSRLAVALIAFLAGAELRWSEVRERGITIVKIMSVELAVTFGVLVTALYGFHEMLPFPRGLTPTQVLVLAVLMASVVIVHSPAVTMAMLTETRAQGPVARTTLGIVLLSDVVVVLAFSGALAVARAVLPTAAGRALGVGALVWEIGGALAVGSILGIAAGLYLRVVRRELLLFAILLAFFGAEIARLARVEMMLALLTAGFMTRNLGGAGAAEGDELRHAMQRSAAPVIVVFFGLAGARIDLAQLAGLFALVLPLAAVRAFGIWAGTRAGSRWARTGSEERRFVWMGLVSQAGVAIALVTVFLEAYPELGQRLATLLLALIAVNEIAGPILFRRALVASGEAAAPAPTGAARLAPDSAT